MRVRNEIMFLILWAFMFTACSDEEKIDIPTDGTTLKVNFQTKVVPTKAATRGEYDKDGELTANNCIIAAFKVNTDNEPQGTCIGYTSSSLSNPTAEGVYSVPFTVQAKENDNIKVFVIANYNQEDFPNNSYSSLSKSMSYDTFKSLYVSLGDRNFEASSLVKVGSTIHTLQKDGTINVDLYQLAARVDVGFTLSGGKTGTNYAFEVTGYTVNSINKASDLCLSDNTYNSQQEFKEYRGTMSTATDNFFFYTYETETSTHPVELSITGTLTKGTTSETKTYKLILNPKASTDNKNRAGILSGLVYKLTGNIDLSTEKVTFTTEVKEWTPVNVNVEIDDMDYLFVSENNFEMPNIDTYTISYEASKAVRIENLTISYQYISNKEIVTLSNNQSSSTGEGGKRLTYKSKVKERPGKDGTSDEDMIVTVSPSAEGIITIASTMPVNLAPLEISFTVTMEGEKATLKQDVKATQYPSNYVTAENAPTDDIGPFWKKGTAPDNPKFFTVNIIAPFKGYSIGYAYDKTTKQTKSDEESNKLISPRFVIASENGKTFLLKQNTKMSPIAYGNEMQKDMGYWEGGKQGEGTWLNQGAIFPSAIEFCKKYREGKYTDGWRLPTLAELEYIRNLEYNYKAAVGIFMPGDEYWSAQKDFGYHFYTREALVDAGIDPSDNEGNENFHPWQDAGVEQHMDGMNVPCPFPYGKMNTGQAYPFVGAIRACCVRDIY